MRKLALAAILAAATSHALAQENEFYVVQNIQTLKCQIVTGYPVTASAKVMVNNKFTQREDAETAMKTLTVCR